MTKNVSMRRPSRPSYRPSLTTQIMIGLVVGVAVGWIRPEWGNNVYFLRDIFLNLIKSIIGSLVRGDILQIVAFAVLFAMAVSAVGEKGKPLLRGMESLSQVMFKLTNYVMKFAPIGVGAAMAHTIGTQGPGVLVSLGNLIFSYYLGLIIFIVFVFGLILVVIQAPIRQFVSAIREPATFAFATTCSESA